LRSRRAFPRKRPRWSRRVNYSYRWQSNDELNDVVQPWKLGSGPLARFGGAGTFAGPTGVALDPTTGQLLVSDGKSDQALLVVRDAVVKDPRSAQAQYALATLYKEGRGVPKDLAKAASLLGSASVGGNIDAMVEFAIAQFNGSGIAKNEAAAAQVFKKAAQRGSPIAQDRLARILMAGRGMPADPTAAIKWHIVAKAGGASDPDLDVFAGKQPQAVRDAAQKAADKWMSTLKAPRP